MAITSQLTARLSLSLVASVLYFLYLPALARNVGPEEFGGFSYTLQICLFLSYLVILKSDFSSLYQGSKSVKVDYSIHQLGLVASLFICVGYGATTNATEAAIIFLLACTHYLSSEVIRVESPVALGVADCAYKLSLIVCTYIAAIQGGSLATALLVAVLVRLVYLLCLVKPTAGGVLQFSIKKAVGQAYAIRWWIASQIIMLTSGFLPLYALKLLYTESQLGLYLFAVSIVGGAQAIIAKAVADVFYTRVSQPMSLYHTARGLVLWAVPTGGVISAAVFFGVFPIEQILGDDWNGANKTFSAVILMSVFGLLSNALDKFPQFYVFEWYTPAFNVFRLLVALFVAWVAHLFDMPFEFFLWILCTAFSITYLVDIIVCMGIIRGTRA